jgi:polysaccharide deacetylase family protein (PEP-CTERM system associated)
MMPTVVNALSIDVEEYYHAGIYREGTGRTCACGLESRVEASVERALRLFSDHEVRATFFVLGEVARATPALVRKIAGEGHELASHGDRHELVSAQRPDEFRQDVRRAKATVEDLSGRSVLGYRAPNFSIGRTEAWAYDVLLEEGFRYDSSVYPILHDRYGDRGAPRFPHAVRANGHGRLLEFPIGTTRVWGMNLPIGGGGYFRLLPVGLSRHGIRRVNRREGRPVMFFFHPWELDPEQPRPWMPWRNRVRHYVGMEREEAKLATLLRSCRFTTAREVLGLEG